MSTKAVVAVQNPSSLSVQLPSPQSETRIANNKQTPTNVLDASDLVVSPTSIYSPHRSLPASPNAEQPQEDVDALDQFKTSMQMQNRVAEQKLTTAQINNHAVKAQAIDAIRRGIYRASTNSASKTQMETPKGHSFLVPCLQTLPTLFHSAVEAEIRRECQTTKYRISINFQLGKIMLMK